MQQNVGKTDRIIRLVAGIGLLALGLMLDGNARWVALLGVPLIASAFTGICFLYYPFKWNSCRLKNESRQ